jgi:hypothetical protein
MSALPTTIALAAPVLSVRRATSVRPPWHAAAAARRTVAGLAPAAAARTQRLARALRRPLAFNAVARDRLFAAVAAALGPGAPTRRHEARRHGALTAAFLMPARPHGHDPGEAPGIALEALLCLAGKAIDSRGTCPLLEVAHHACARFVERAGRADPAALHAAVAEAAGHAPAVLLAHLDGGVAYRLRGGSASVLLPAGEGAFVGWLRLLPGPRDRRPMAAIEAATWLHVADLDTPQLAARDVLLAGLPPVLLVEALPEAWGGLSGPVSGDRRRLAGLEVVPFPADRPTRLALACSQAAAVARLALGLACADTLAAERLGLR